MKPSDKIKPLYFTIGERDINVIYAEDTEIKLTAIPNNDFTAKLLLSAGAEQRYEYLENFKELYEKFKTNLLIR